MAQAEIGILGGSGFYDLLDAADEVTVDTPFGPPSDALVTGTFAGRQVAFLPRHGRGHRIPAHRINFRANLWALHELGVSRVVAPCAVGSLQPELAPGTFVVLDQVVDRTAGRADTFYDGPDAARGVDATVTHVSLADPYCPEMRATALESLIDLGIPHRSRGTNVVIQGPRFSTRAESRWFTTAGWEVVGMTQYPEVALARELAMCMLGVALVTDFDAGLEAVRGPVSAREVLEMLQANVANLRRLLEQLAARLPGTRSCGCAAALEAARLG